MPGVILSEVEEIPLKLPLSFRRGIPRLRSGWRRWHGQP